MKYKIKSSNPNSYCYGIYKNEPIFTNNTPPKDFKLIAARKLCTLWNKVRIKSTIKLVEVKIIPYEL